MINFQCISIERVRGQNGVFFTSVASQALRYLDFLITYLD